MALVVSPMPYVSCDDWSRDSRLSLNRSGPCDDNWPKPNTPATVVLLVGSEGRDSQISEVRTSSGSLGSWRSPGKDDPDAESTVFSAALPGRFSH